MTGNGKVMDNIDEISRAKDQDSVANQCIVFFTAQTPDNIAIHLPSHREA